MGEKVLTFVHRVCKRVGRPPAAEVLVGEVECLLQLGVPVGYIDVAEILVPARQLRRRTIRFEVELLIGLATATARQGRVDEACGLGMQSLDLAAARSELGVSRVRQLRRELDLWHDSDEDRRSSPSRPDRDVDSEPVDYDVKRVLRQESSPVRPRRRQPRWADGPRHGDRGLSSLRDATSVGYLPEVANV